MNAKTRISMIVLLVIPGVMAYAQPAQTDAQIYEFITVDEKPRVLQDKQPVYPQSAIDAGVEGTVVVTVIIGTDGKVTRAEIFRSVPQLDNAALVAARGKVFSPGLVNGSPVRTRMNIPIEFVLPTTEAVSEAAETPGADVVDLTGEAVVIKVEPERPRVNIIADRIKPEFGNINLEKSFIPELLGRAERIEIVSHSKEEALKPIDTKQALNRAR